MVKSDYKPQLVSSMKTTFNKSAILLLSLCFVFVSCKNLFNPSGAAPSSDQSADVLISYGESLLRAKDNDEAFNVFSKALEKDSTKSRAYYGLCKAIMRKNNLSPSILAEVFVEITETQDSLANDPTANVDVINTVKSIIDKNEKLTRVMDELKVVLDVLIYREQLTTLWQTHLTANPDDTLFQEFDYEGNDLITSATFFDSTYTLAEFPLTDYEITEGMLRIEIKVADNIVAFKEILDIIPTDIITNIQDVLDKVDSTGSIDVTDVLAVDSAIFEKDEVDSSSLEEAEKLNQQLDLLEDATDLLDLDNVFASDAASDSLLNDDSESNNPLDEFSDVIFFYRFSDGIDNDGDGCIDEELKDEIDNDGDGFIDEDARIAKTDLVDNDMDGTVDNAEELLNENGILIFAAYADDATRADTTNFWLDSAKLAIIDTDDRDYKVNVAKDTEFKIYSLNDRIRDMGGCWPNAGWQN